MLFVFNHGMVNCSLNQTIAKRRRGGGGGGGGGGVGNVITFDNGRAGL